VPEADTLTLTKHHGAGNDFLVLVDPEGGTPLGADQARALCDRHLGVGADGLLTLGPPADGAALSMVLRNADGGLAEMSGNGLRCLAQAAVLAGLAAPPRFTVATAAGVRTVTYTPSEAPWLADAAVDMGPVTLGPDVGVPFEGALRARRADVGNPHLVVQVPDARAVAVAVLGPELEAAWPGGMNVEFVSTDGAGGLDLAVWERGAGVTLACGTGTCASAEVARAWGLAGDRVAVANPGGRLEVTLGAAPGDPVTLAGPVRKVAEVTVDRHMLS